MNRRKMLFVIFVLNVVIFLQVQALVKSVQRQSDAYNMETGIEGVLHMFRALERKPDSIMINVPSLSQTEIPTGCESVSTVSVLQYCGVDITPEVFIRSFLPCEAFYRKAGVLYGADPYEAFAGNPFVKESLGCFPPVIIKALENMTNCGYEGMEHIVFDDVSGVDLTMLEEVYLAKNVPVILWATSAMKPSYPGMQYYLSDGSLYTWPAGEHCMVLCGYDAEKYFFMDPQTEGQVVSYAKELVEARFEEMGRGAIVIK